MRQLTKEEIKRVEILTENSIEIALIEPTQTGLKKSIMDATGSIRNFLFRSGLHDYTNQKQGQSHKVQITSFFVELGTFKKSVASLYRPETKNGDPRIWFKGLPEYAKANDILALFKFGNDLYVINITQIDINRLVNFPLNNRFKELIGQLNSISNSVADELLSILKKLARKGPIPALLEADTSIGRTLEHALNIKINSSKKPDYKGIELKAFRDKKGNRKNLFAQVPDWDISKLKSSEEILNRFGYKRGQEHKLYCTVSAITTNSQGLKLRIDGHKNQLFEYSKLDNIGDFVSWKLETLHNRLVEKHAETFWISADSFNSGGTEYFQYKLVEHTKGPIITQFDVLIDQGIITLDHLIKRGLTGKVVEKGPLFKIRPTSLSLLFPPSKKYTLLEG